MIDQHRHKISDRLHRPYLSGDAIQHGALLLRQYRGRLPHAPQIVALFYRVHNRLQLLPRNSVSVFCSRITSTNARA